MPISFIDGGEPAQLTQKLTTRPIVSPDGKWIACVWSQPIDGGQPRQLTDFTTDNQDNSPDVVMLSFGYWQRRFANLLLVRSEGRAHEFAIRAALGAGRGRIAREMFAESLALALMGGCLGVGFAFAVVKLVLKLSPARLPRFEQISVDSIALLFTLGISLVAGFALGAIPVLKHGGVRLAESLRAGGRNASAGRERNISRNTLAVVQVGLALVLLIGSGLMIRTFQAIRRVHPGFSNPEELQTLRISIDIRILAAAVAVFYAVLDSQFSRAVVGIYAVISYTVAQRTREIGIRMALGAQHGELKRMFVGKGLIWSGIGAAAGLTAAIALSRLMSALLFEISPMDPLTYTVAAVGILASAAVASYMPARRVTRVDPIEALRSE